MSYLLSALSLIGFYSIAKKISYISFKDKNNIIINIFTFLLIFFFIYIVNTYLFLLKISSQFFSIGMISISLVLGLLFLIKNISKIYSFSKKEFYSKTILMTLSCFFILSHLMPTDEDSIRYHLEIPQKIIDGTFYQNHWLDYLVIGSNEFINLFGIHLGFYNTSSILNFSCLVFIILSNNYFFKKKNIGSAWLGHTLILSSPYIIPLIGSQKLFLLPSYISAYTIAYLYIFKKDISYKSILLIVAINIFSVSTKPIFLPYLAIVLFFATFVIRFNFKEKIFILIFSFVILLVALFPLALIKYKIYQDPFLPIISINKLNSEWWNVYNKEFLTAWQMDVTDSFLKIYQILLIPIKLILPLHPSDLFKCLGLGMFFLYFLDFKKNKNLIFFIILFVLSVLILGNYQSRWFLPLLLLVGIFAKEIKFKILNNLVKLQLLFSLAILIPLAFAITFPNLFNFNDLVFSQKKIIDTMNTKYKDQRYFTNHNSFFYFKNEIPMYMHEKQILARQDRKFFKKNSEVKLFLYQVRSGESFEQFSKKNLNCNSFKILEKFNYNSRRFFLVDNKSEVILYKQLC